MRLAFSLLVLAFACSEVQPQKEFDGAQAFRYVEQQLAFGPRIPGTEGHRRAGDWIDSLLRQRADTVVVQSWRHATLRGDTLPLRNFLARFNPGAERRILFLAHWDTRPASGPDSALDRSRPVPGANDGGSGVAVLLGMADALRARPPAIGVDLLFVDGEDYGIFSEGALERGYGPDVLIGSTHFARNLPPGPRPRFAVLFDLVGDRDLVIFHEGYSNIAAPEVVNLVWDAAAELGYQGYFRAEPGPSLTDEHIPLQRAGISAINVVDFNYGPDNRWWHTPEDTIDKVSAASLEVVGNVGMWVVRRESR